MNLIFVHLIKKFSVISKLLLFHNLLRLLAKCRVSFYSLWQTILAHTTKTLDGLNTFYGTGTISAVTPGIKCTPRIISCLAVTAEDVVAVAKVDIHFYKNVESFNIKYEKLPEIGKDDTFRNTDKLWK